MRDMTSEKLEQMSGFLVDQYTSNCGDLTIPVRITIPIKIFDVCNFYLGPWLTVVTEVLSTTGCIPVCPINNQLPHLISKIPGKQLRGRHAGIYWL